MAASYLAIYIFAFLVSIKASRAALEGIVPAARMAFELPPRLRLEQERRAEKQPKSNNSGSGPMKKGEGLLELDVQNLVESTFWKPCHVAPAGQPWTSEEHLQFLAGLRKLGRSNWRGISRYFVPTRTPTQVSFCQILEALFAPLKGLLTIGKAAHC